MIPLDLLALFDDPCNPDGAALARLEATVRRVKDGGGHTSWLEQQLDDLMWHQQHPGEAF